MVEAAGEEEQELAAEMAAAFLNENLPENTFGAPKAGQVLLHLNITIYAMSLWRHNYDDTGSAVRAFRFEDGNPLLIKSIILNFIS